MPNRGTSTATVGSKQTHDAISATDPADGRPTPRDESVKTRRAAKNNDPMRRILVTATASENCLPKMAGTSCGAVATSTSTTTADSPTAGQKNDHIDDHL